MWKAVLLWGVLMGVASASGPAQRSSELLVVNQGDRSLSVVDPASGAVVAAIPVGGVTGHEVAVTPDGTTAFVPIYGDSGVGKPGTDGSSMAVIDLLTRKVRGRVDFGHGVRPHCAIFARRQGVLYVTTELDRTVSIVDPKTLTVVGTIPTGQAESHMLAVSRDGRRGYTANVGAGTVSVLDLEGRKTVAVIPVARQVQRIALSADDRLVFTADQDLPRLAVIDAGTNQVVRWVELPGIGYGTAATADGRHLLVTLPGMGRLAVLDLGTMTTVRTFETGREPVQVLLRPDGRVAYVSCLSGGGVTEIVMDGEVSAWTVRRRVPTGSGADGMAWSAR